jgi:pimeloyl-ACP methyl ester carboxylesterase
MSANFQIARVEGRAVHYLDAGEAAAPNVLLLAHAFPVGAQLFAPQLGAFTGWRVVAPSMPGFDGGALLSEASADTYARLLIGLMDELTIPRAVVGGVSMGGHVTFGMLRHAPERVVAVVLADTRSEADAGPALEGRRRLLDVAMTKGPSAVADEMVPKLLGGTTVRTRPEVVERVRRLIEGQSTEAIAAAIRVLMTRPDSTPMLRRIQVPALVIVGAEDSLTPPAEMQKMAAGIPGATFVEIPRAGHLANLEAPAEFNAAVAAWLPALPR